LLSAYEVRATFGEKECIDEVLPYFEEAAALTPAPQQSQGERLRAFFDVLVKTRKDLDYTIVIREDEDDDHEDENGAAIPDCLLSGPVLTVQNQVSECCMDLSWLKPLCFENHALFRFCFYTAQLLINKGVNIVSQVGWDDYTIDEQWQEQIEQNLSEISDTPCINDVELLRQNEKIRRDVNSFLKGNAKWWINKLDGALQKPTIYGPLPIKGEFQHRAYLWARAAYDVWLKNWHLEGMFYEGYLYHVLGYGDQESMIHEDTFRFYWDEENWVTSTLMGDREINYQQLSTPPALDVIELKGSLLKVNQSHCANLDYLNELLTFNVYP
jgi:hypothetical protein